jgi:hypothetical protein
VKKYVASPEGGGEFLMPMRVDGLWTLVGVSSGRVYSHGMVVYVGRELKASDVFAKAVEAGHRIDSVGELMAAIRGLLRVAEATKIGGKVELTGEGEARAV